MQLVHPDGIIHPNPQDLAPDDLRPGMEGDVTADHSLPTQKYGMHFQATFPAALPEKLGKKITQAS